MCIMSYNPQRNYQYHSHFTDEKTWDLKWLIWPKIHSKYQKMDPALKFSDLTPYFVHNYISIAKKKKILEVESKIQTILILSCFWCTYLSCFPERLFKKCTSLREVYENVCFIASFLKLLLMWRKKIITHCVWIYFHICCPLVFVFWIVFSWLLSIFWDIFIDDF